MEIDDYLETFPKPGSADEDAARTCRECHHINVNPPVLDREQGLGAGIWRCRRCGADNVETGIKTAEPKERFRSSSEKLGEEVRTHD